MHVLIMCLVTDHNRSPQLSAAIFTSKAGENVSAHARNARGFSASESYAFVHWYVILDLTA